jgi:hypothetical protein
VQRLSYQNFAFIFSPTHTTCPTISSSLIWSS